MFAVIGDGIGARRVDHDRAVMPHLLLSARMAVIPVGAALPNRELIDEGLTRADAGKAHAWHTVHREWHEKAVPMDRAVLVELVGDRQPDILPLLEDRKSTRLNSSH